MLVVPNEKASWSVPFVVTGSEAASVDKKGKREKIARRHASVCLIEVDGRSCVVCNMKTHGPASGMPSSPAFSQSGPRDGQMTLPLVLQLAPYVM